ncbi:MAG: NYN domain-containing protein [Ilumatobacteraceae bacterium]|jgi:uncharacterized LabA/DUF88 family protein
MARVNAYVDGFNLYHGAKELVARLGTTESWKWIDLSQLVQRICPQDEVVDIKYFTALVSPTKSDPSLASRQQIYLRALESAGVTVVLGNFMRQTKRMPLARQPRWTARRLLQLSRIGAQRHGDGNTSVPVVRTEEKATDVNLGVHLVSDGFTGDFDRAVVISNDTDLQEPVRMVAQELGRRVTVVNPRGHRQPAVALRRVATDVRNLRIAALTASQFSDELHDEIGVFSKPMGW